MNFRRVVSLVVVASVLLLVFSPRNFLADTLTTDPASYLAHALTLGLDFDLDYSNEPVMCLNQSVGSPCHPIGSGLFAAPFVAVFSILDRIVDAPVLSDHRNFQYSWSFFGFTFSHSVYFVLGLWLYAFGFQRIGIKVSRSRVLLYCASFGMAYYTFQNAQMSHVYQFFSLGLAFWGAAGMWQAARNGVPAFSSAVVASVGVMLAIVVRPQDAIAVLLPGIVIFSLWAIQREGDAKLTGQTLRMASLYTLTTALMFIPLAVYNGSVYGKVFPTASDMYGGGRMKGVDNALEIVTEGVVGRMSESEAVSLLSDISRVVGNFFKILFYSEFGLLYTAPIFIFGVASLLGLVIMYRKNIYVTVANILAILLYVGLPVAIVLYWGTTASFYGFRYLYPIFPLAIFGYALFIRQYKIGAVERSPLSGASMRLVDLSLTLFCTLALLSQMFYGSSESLGLSAGINVFGNRHHMTANGYVFHLIDALMSPSSWVQMVAHRLPGFLGFEVLRLFSVDLTEFGTTFGFPTESLEAGFARYNGLPLRAVLQVLIAFVFSLVTIVLFLWQGERRTAPK